MSQTVGCQCTQIAAKARAGFKLYVPAGFKSSGGSPIRDEREITAGVLWL